MKKTYSVKAGRSGKWWWIEIPEVDMGFTQAKTFREVPTMAREVISLLLKVPEDSFDVAVQIQGEEAELVAKVEKFEAAAEAAQRAAELEKRKVIKALQARGLSVRDVAELLHVSRSWVSVLGKEAA